jgi:hypothetical protein
MVCEHTYQVERKKGLFDNSIHIIWCPKCGDIKVVPPTPRSVEVPR